MSYPPLHSRVNLVTLTSQSAPFIDISVLMTLEDAETRGAPELLFTADTDPTYSTFKYQANTEN